MSSIIRSSMVPLRKRTFFTLGALTLTLGFAARFRSLAISHRPILFRPSAFSQSFTIASSMATSFTKAPQPPLRWDHAPEEVLQLTKDAIQRDREVCAANRMSRETNAKIYTVDP
jgi:hypothetical protein